MKRIHRRMLFFSATVVFLALAPLVILYAMGYRRGGSAVDPIPVGVLLVETVPRRADVVVGGRNEGKSPRAIPNVPAGDVPITISKEGYRPWQKNIPVRPGLVADVRGIRLFADTSPPQIVAADALLFSLSPDRRLIAYVDTARRLHVIDADQQEWRPPVLLPTVPAALTWSPSSDALLLRNTNRTYVAMRVSDALPPQPLPALRGALVATWDERIPGRLLVQTGEGALRAYNVSNNSSRLIDREVVSFATSERYIYTLHADGKVALYNLQGAFVRTLSVQLTDTTGRQLLVTPDGHAALWRAQGPLDLIEGEELKRISETTEIAAWSPDGQMLLVQADATSLYVYNAYDKRALVPEGELHLVSRLSRPISHPQWFAGGQHLIFQVQDEIIISEIDTRDHALSVGIDSVNIGNAQISVGEEGAYIVYLRRDDGQQRLVRTVLLRDEE